MDSTRDKARNKLCTLYSLSRQRFVDGEPEFRFRMDRTGYEQYVQICRSETGERAIFTRILPGQPEEAFFQLAESEFSLIESVPMHILVSLSQYTECASDRAHDTALGRSLLCRKCRCDGYGRS